MSGVCVGVDLGGTNIRASLSTPDGSPGAIVRHATPAREGPEAVLRAVATCVREAARNERLRGVAIGIPGPLNPATGLVHTAPHLSGWREVPAGDILGAALDCPVAVRNDATLAGWAEWSAGAGKGSRYFVFVTASTGIGGAIVADGRLYEGVTGSAGEIGHAPASPDGPPCSQGHPGCLEGTASGTAIAVAARRAVTEGAETSLRATDLAGIDARVVEEAARNGDRLAMDLFAAAGRALGRGLGGLINLLAPEVIAVGGGLINAGALLFAPLRHGVSEMAFEYPASRCRIVQAELGTDAGIVGAVSWARHSFG